mgnify:FL=1
MIQIDMSLSADTDLLKIASCIYFYKKTNTHSVCLQAGLDFLPFRSNMLLRIYCSLIRFSLKAGIPMMIAVHPAGAFQLLESSAFSSPKTLLICWISGFDILFFVTRFFGSFCKVSTTRRVISFSLLPLDDALRIILL